MNRLEFNSFCTRHAFFFSEQDIFGFPTTEGTRVQWHRRPMLDHLAKVANPNPGLFGPDRASSQNKTTSTGRIKQRKGLRGQDRQRDLAHTDLEHTGLKISKLSS